jgi:hypothetical protein
MYLRITVDDPTMSPRYPEFRKDEKSSLEMLGLELFSEDVFKRLVRASQRISTRDGFWTATIRGPGRMGTFYPPSSIVKVDVISGDG